MPLLLTLAYARGTSRVHGDRLRRAAVCANLQRSAVRGRVATSASIVVCVHGGVLKFASMVAYCSAQRIESTVVALRRIATHVVTRRSTPKNCSVPQVVSTERQSAAANTARWVSAAYAVHPSSVDARRHAPPCRMCSLEPDRAGRLDVSLITHHPSLVICHPSLITYHSPFLTHHSSFVTHQSSVITRHFSHITHHLSLATH